ncbi:Rrf2 family transcriptional regulator [bacterium]|nr:Rrf2 family transcriptional regulator [bacterium]
MDMLRLSEAASLALHTMVFLSGHPEGQASAREIARDLNVSEAHLAKVLQRLARYGLVNSVRGPKGGFSIAPGRDNATLLDIYEAIEGPIPDRKCLRSTSICTGKHCIFGNLLEDVNKQVKDYMAETSLPDLAETFGGRVETVS